MAVLVLGGAGPFSARAFAAGPPLIVESWVTEVTATSAVLAATINPNDASTSYHFEFVTQAAYEASGYATAQKIPVKDVNIGSGTTTLPPVSQTPKSLTPATAYRYRVVATNSEGPAPTLEHAFGTKETGKRFSLPDGRGWELVSPVDKGGGAIAVPGGLFGGGEFQGAADGGAVTYGAATAFDRAKGSPPASQYVSTRTTGGWSTESVSPALESAAYGDHPDGAPYRVFSTDLSRSLLFGGLPCRGGLEGCAAPNPVLPGTGAPAGFMAYYLRDGASGSFTSLLGEADLEHTLVSPEGFEVSFAAASADLSHVLLSSCAKLTANATEVVASGRCNPEEANLYERSAGGLSLVNLPPGGTTGMAGARVAAPLGAVSEDGSRVYWTLGADLYLRDGAQSLGVDEAKGGDFQVASADGAIAFFTKSAHLYRFALAEKASEDLTPSGGVIGVLGASADGTSVYFQDAAGIERWHQGATTLVAPGAEAALPSDYPPATGTSRVSPDGSHLAFLSNASLTGYDNVDVDTKQLDTELFLYGLLPGGGAPQLLCASCNLTGERPQGPTSIPGALVNGTTRAYKPRVLVAGGSRLFFDSLDDVGERDSNELSDVYEWEAQGVGDCLRRLGCARSVSSGLATEGATFLDASADGSDVYFTTNESLVGADPSGFGPGSVDLYDARVGGGFVEPEDKIICVGDACQPLPSPPEDPDPGTLVKNEGNRPLQIAREGKRRHKKAHRRKHRNGHGKFHVTLKRGGRR